LTWIEVEAFAETRLHSVIVPGSTSFIAVGAFPHHRAVTLAGADSDAKSSEWNLRWWSGFSDVFE
jgi:siroheme synthase